MFPRPLFSMVGIGSPIRRHRINHSHQSRLIWKSLLLFGLGFFSQAVAAQPDPVKNFCRRFGHQAAVVDRKLYIDGGLLNYSPPSQYPGNYSNTGLLYHDLDTTGSGGMPQLFANLTKNNSVSSVHGGTLWVDNVNKRFYLFGGEHYQQPPSPYYTLWSFDVLNNQWVSSDAPSYIKSVSYGAGVSVSERGEGYYYGGWLSNNSVPDWSGPPVPTTGLIKYSMDTNTWSNGTGPDSVKRAEGAMVFIPIGDGGMLVYFGGVQDKYSNGTMVGQAMEKIYLYDVLSSKWYSQTATGTVPQMRAKFCAGATWAPDKSSYNIYLYGGAGIAPDTAGFDDVYILSIPSFQWIKLYPNDNKNNETGQYPHHSLTCNVIDGAQMMIIGGTFPLTQDCDVPDQFGSHNLDLGQQNSERSSWQLYRSNLTSYVVPEPIISIVGGSAGGGATKTSPANGFSNPDLKVLMTRKANIAMRTPTRAINGPTSSAAGGSNNSKTLSTGAIAGIAFGSTAGIISVLIGCIWFMKHRRRGGLRALSVGDDKMTVPSGAHIDGQGPWSPQSTNTASYLTPQSNPSSPFQQVRSPIELEAPPGSNVWRSADGLTYELASPGTGQGREHTRSPGDRSWSGGSGELQTKVDSEGRMWVQVPLPFHHGGSISPGGQSRQPGYSPVTPMSSYNVSPAPVPVEAVEPQELPGGAYLPVEVVRETGGEPGLEGGGGGGDVAHTGPRHQTYYHP